MKNTIKMSLAAALAVSALSTTASAGNLEDAIKDVTISGKMEVEYDYLKTKANATAQDVTENEWDLDWDVTAKIPVNDTTTAVFGLEGDTTTDIANEDINADKGSDNVQVTKLYFQNTMGPVTTMVGKQGMAGAPWFDDERANGVVALVNAGPVTLAAAHFTGSNANANGTTLLEGTDITAFAAIGSMGPVNAQLWYANLAGVNANIDADSIVAMVDGTFGPVGVSVKYGTTTYDGLSAGADDDAEMIQAVVSADLEVAAVYGGMGMTDKEQAVAGLDLTKDTDSAIDFGSEQLSIDDLNNATAYIVGATVPMGDLTLGASYVFGEYDIAANTSGDYTEALVEVDYKVSKNFKIGSHYSMAEIDTSATATEEKDAASVSLEYKF